MHRATHLRCTVPAGLLLWGLISPALAAAPQLGLYEWGAGSAAPNTGPAGIDYFSAWLGKPISLASDFTDYSQGWDNMQAPSWQYQPWQAWIQAKPGRNLMIGYPLIPGVAIDRLLPNGTYVSYAACAAGQYNGYYANFAQGLMNYGIDHAIIRLSWEFDGNWYAWSVLDGEEPDFISCWQQAVTTMRAAAPGNHFTFVWNVDTYYQSDRNGISWLQTTYPGDAYVDTVAIDLYDDTWDNEAYPFPVGCTATCIKQRRAFAWKVDHMVPTENLLAFAKLHGKSFGFGEFGVTQELDWVNGVQVEHGGLDNVSYVQDMLNFIELPSNNVAFAVVFDILAGDGDHRISPAAGTTQFPNASARFHTIFAKHTGTLSTGGSSGVSTIPVPATGTAAFNITVPVSTAGFTYDSNAQNWGYMLPGAYLQFNVSTAVAGTYSLAVNEATQLAGAKAAIVVNGITETTLDIPNTNGWAPALATLPVPIQLPAGASSFRIQDAAGQSFNIFGLSLTLLAPADHLPN